MNLFEIGQNKIATIINIAAQDEIIDAKLREIGFAEGDEVEVFHFGPLGRTPICIRLNQTLIALRPNEAAAIEVKINEI